MPESNGVPKVIHYCWFGGNPLPELAEKCIASWKKYCPDYKIVEWNESNFDLSCCKYVREAYEAKKWAFVSDYARFRILYEFGGIYFDADVELIRPVDDIVQKGPFLGMESPGMVNAGLGMGAEAGMPVYQEIIQRFHERTFETQGDRFYQQTVVSFVSDILRKYGLNDKDEIQRISGITIYPSEYFNPKDYVTGEVNRTENTRTIHHFTASWLTPREKRWYVFEGKIGKKFGKEKIQKLRRSLLWWRISFLYKYGIRAFISRAIRKLGR